MVEYRKGICTILLVGLGQWSAAASESGPRDVATVTVHGSATRTVFSAKSEGDGPIFAAAAGARLGKSSLVPRKLGQSPANDSVATAPTPAATFALLPDGAGEDPAPGDGEEPRVDESVGGAMPGTCQATTPMSGRSEPLRSRRLVRHGGSRASEAAVAAALKWFAGHQLDDGRWSFDHTLAPECQGKCANPGSLKDASNAATALALLAFLGSGETHRAGRYRKAVRSGLHYLVESMKITDEGGTLSENGGRMYSHGLAAIALTEAYAMTQDRDLLRPAQAVVNYICYAQDPVGGGWRYMPRQAGDTSVTGWQVTALKTAHMAYLQVPPAVVKKTSSFLDGVQADGGAAYGYTGPGEGQATTAIGLLCRMHLGWKRDNPALQRGIEQIADWGVSTKGNMYYNHYATQVTFHWGGDVWKKWNGQMRDWLIESQEKRGHEAGSWFFKGADHGADRGGRHYITAMAAMMLQTYYRHRPIYRQKPEPR